MIARYVAINEEVCKQLEDNSLLFLVWSLTHTPIDPDFDPMHQRGWVESRMRDEYDWLDSAREAIVSANEKHAEFVAERKQEEKARKEKERLYNLRQKALSKVQKCLSPEELEALDLDFPLEDVF